MKFYMIRFKGATNPKYEYTPRSHIAYALLPTQVLDNSVKLSKGKDTPYDYAHGSLTSEDKAGVYPSERSLRAAIRVIKQYGKGKIINFLNKYDIEPIYSYYEVVEVDNGKITAIPFDDFLK